MYNFSELSINITKSLTTKEKKHGGIFFTPKIITKKLIDSLELFLDINKYYDILEPSCGSCEFINQLMVSKISTNKILCVEKNVKIYKQILKYEYIDNIELINDDFLNIKKKQDIIIGNPPFFVIDKKIIPKEYEKYFEGRPNIFTLFIIHSLNLLNDNGFLCFVIPTSFLNSKYYNKVREYINEYYSIKEIIMFDNNNFIDTEQKVLGIIIQKTKTNNNNNFVIKINDNTFFFDKSNKIILEKLLETSTTIKKMGLTVRTGTIIWNKYKEYLTDNKNNKILVYNSNIIANKFIFKNFNNPEKKQYININESQEGPIIVVNRGNGNAKYNFTYCYLDKTINNNFYLIENHLNMVLGNEKDLKKILKSFEDSRTKEFINIFCGNNGFSKTEIETILPIYL